MSSPLTILVTGSNRGIGLGILQLLAKTPHNPPLHIIASSRSGTDLGVHPTPPNTVSYTRLDISSSTSISTFTSRVKDVDVLINNAGINNNPHETPELAEQVLDVNYKGTRDMCTALLSTPGARVKRIVNVSSTACELRNYDPNVQSSFRAVKSINDIDALAAQYVAAVQSGASAQKAAGFGSPPKSYQVSKALMNALTVVLAREYPGVLVNCCCPGWVDTDMGHQVGRPPKTLEEGARIPVRLAIGELGEGGDEDGGLGRGGGEMVSGRYFGNDGVANRGWGRAREW